MSLLLKSLVLVLVVAADPLSAWTPGPDAALDNTYLGSIDAPASNANVPNGAFSVSGWFFDTTAEGWAGADNVQLWLGTMDGGGRLIGNLSFAESRPDVAAALGNASATPSGFSGDVPAGALGLGQQTLSVYVHTPNKGWWYRQVEVNVVAPVPAATPAPSAGSGLPVVAFERPKDSEQVLTKSDYDIIGYALDPQAGPNQGIAGSGIDRVSVYLGARDEGGQFLGDADLGFSDTAPVGQYGGQFDTAGWRLTFHPTRFHSNTYLLYAYAHSAVTGREDWAVRYFAIREQ